MTIKHDEAQTETVPIKLSNGAIVRIEVDSTDGREKVANKILSFDPVKKALEGIVDDIAEI